jgi:hypothetical protein
MCGLNWLAEQAPFSLGQFFVVRFHSNKMVQQTVGDLLPDRVIVFAI